MTSKYKNAQIVQIENHFFTWESLRQDVFLICSSNKVIIWNKSWNLSLIGLKLEEKQLTRYYKQEQVILEI